MNEARTVKDWIYSNDSTIISLIPFIGLFLFFMRVIGVAGISIFGVVWLVFYTFREKIFHSEYKNIVEVIKPGVDWTVGQNILRGIILISAIIGFIFPVFLFEEGKMSYETFSENFDLLIMFTIAKVIACATMMFFAISMIINRGSQRGVYLRKLVLTDSKIIVYGIKKYDFKYSESNWNEIGDNLLSFNNISNKMNFFLDLNIFKKQEREIIRKELNNKVQNVNR